MAKAAANKHNKQIQTQKQKQKQMAKAKAKAKANTKAQATQQHTKQVVMDWRRGSIAQATTKQTKTKQTHKQN